MASETSGQNPLVKFCHDLYKLYHSSTTAGEYSAQYWADIAVNSKHPLAPLANIPGVFAALWTPKVAPQTAFTLATAGWSFISLPKNLIHFTTVAGAEGIAATGAINATRIGLFGPGVYMAAIGRPLNLFIQAQSKIPILLNTPAGVARIIPYLVYVRWGFNSLKIP